MQQYQRIACAVFAALLLLPAVAVGVPLPKGLENVLRVHNFNMYSVPCPANNMVLRDVKGRTVDLSGLRGKVVILNFWKIDCPACLSEKPVLERIFRKYGDRGLEIVAVNLFDDFNRLKSFAHKSGFGFTMCGDPKRSFFVRRQPLPGGEPSTFIVNSKSEAIYEVPGVPTTYLIDRSGNVVGNSIGSVDWEDPPLARLLECMLGSPEPKFASAETGEVFSDAAGTGELPAPEVRSVGPTQRGATDSSSPKTHPEKRLTGKQKSTQEGRHRTKGKTTASSDRRPTKGKSHARAPALSPHLQKAASPPQAKSAKKPIRLAQLRRQYATPKPYSQPPTSTTAQGAPRPYVPQPGSGLAPSVPKPYRAPAATAPQPSPQRPTRSPSPLPAAIPYTPPQFATKRGAVPRVVPDENGTVMARVPPLGSPSTAEGQQRFPQGVAPRSPVPKTPSGGNALQDLILDSFNRSVAPPRPRGPEVRPIAPPSAGQQAQQQPVQPAGSIFSQVGRDFRDLGTGIGEAFSRIWPSRR